MHKPLRRQFSKESKAETIDLIRSSAKPLAQICRDIGLSESTSQRWVAQLRATTPNGKGLTTAEREELSRLRREMLVVRAREAVRRRSGYRGAFTGRLPYDIDH